MPARTDQNPILDIETLTAFLDREFPQINDGGRVFFIEAVGPMTCRVRMAHHPKNLRPGGTVSGPAMFALADVGLYIVVLAHIGPVALAVTTSLTIDFLRKPEPRDLIAECRLLKLGKSLAVGTVMIFSEGSDAPVAHASGTYSIPRSLKTTVL